MFFSKYRGNVEADWLAYCGLFGNSNEMASAFYPQRIHLMDSTGVGWSAKATQGSGGGDLFCTEQQEEEVIMAVVNVLPHNWPISCKSLVRCKNGVRIVHHICWGLQVRCLQVDVFQWWRSDWENGQRRGAGRGMVIDWRPTGSAQTRLISVPQYQIIP